MFLKEEIMKIDQAIKALTAVRNRIGNVEICVDTEAGIFPCHYVDINRVWSMTKDESPDGKAFCFIRSRGYAKGTSYAL